MHEVPRSEGIIESYHTGSRHVSRKLGPPDVGWFMVGVPNGDGRVKVVASTQLERATLTKVVPPGAHAPWPSLEVTDPAAVTWHVTGTMRLVVEVVADTYREAMMLLLGSFNPDDEGGPPALPG